MTIARIAPWTCAAALVTSASLAGAQSAAPTPEAAPAPATPSAPATQQAPQQPQPYAQPGAQTQAPAYGTAPQGAPPPAQGQPGQPPPAGSQGQAPAGPPPGQQIYIEQPPPPPPVPRNRHYHDGFYTRLGVGLGHLWTTAKVDVDAINQTATARLSGTGMMLDLAVGGTPAPGLVIGGALLLQDSFEPSVSFDGGPLTGSQQQSTAKNDSLGFVLLGPMIDGFPDTDGGLHVGGSVGAAVLGLADNQGNAAKGLGLSAWVGYLWWVSSQWSIGGTARFTVAGTGRDLDIGKSSETTRVLGLNLTALYH